MYELCRVHINNLTITNTTSLYILYICVYFIYILIIWQLNTTSLYMYVYVHIFIYNVVHEILWLCRVPTFECHHPPSCLVGLFKPKHILFCLYSDKQKTMKCKYDIIANIANLAKHKLIEMGLVTLYTIAMSSYTIYNCYV